MQRNRHLTHFAAPVVTAGVLAAAVLVGCTPQAATVQLKTEAEAQAFLEARQATLAAKQKKKAPQPAAVEAEPDVAALQAQAEQMLAQMNLEETPAASQEIAWSDAQAAEQAPAESHPFMAMQTPAETEAADETPAADSTEEAATATEPEAAAEPAVIEPAAAEPEPAAEPMSREALVAALLDRTAEDADAFRAAVAAALLSPLTAEQTLTPDQLAGLSDAERDQVVLFQQVLLTAEAKLAAAGKGGDTFDRDTLDAALDEAFGEKPISIRKIELCRRVQGYGVYEPFSNHTFVVGKPHKMILYVELDDFETRELSADSYEVRLEQEVVAYNDSDGLAVWRHDPVEVVDRSRNQRRDFFVVQVITLPARLSVGKYQLTVSVSDKHGGSLDERRVEVNIVADERLATAGEASAEEKLKLLKTLFTGGEEEDGQKLVTP